ncbi:MAG: ATP-binding protein [Chlorobi bacterium]|nr:ATP-binding protein [Chlorobiota bacterium]
MEKVGIGILNQLSELHKVNETLEQLGKKWGLETPVLMSLNLCVEEALTNVIRYAYTEEAKYQINITFEHGPQEVGIIVEDEGKAFNPLEEVMEPDVSAQIENRPIGGLGVFLIRQFMDEVTYQRIGNINQLRMLKRI